MDDTNTSRLLRQVQVRMRTSSFARSAFGALMAASALYAVLLLASRLLGVLPAMFTWPTLLALPVVALVAALVMYRRADLSDAARVVDVRMRTKDLFLTAAKLDNAPGAYHELVKRDAEARASSCRPQTAVPFEFWPRTLNAVTVLVLLLAAVQWLPQLDPFKAREAEQRLAQRRQRLNKELEITKIRADELKRASDTELSRPVQTRVEELKNAFKLANPNDKAGNLRKLTDQQRMLEEAWRKTSQEKLKDALKRNQSTQRFGSGQTAKSQQWKKDLENGDASSMKKEMKDIQKKVEELADTKDPAKQQQLRQQIQNKLQNLADFANNQLDASDLSAALNRALQQLDMSALDGLQNDGLQSMQKSLSLSQMEMDSLAKSLRDMNKLQEALKTLQMAKSLNNLQPLDGKACSQCQGLSDYAKLYSQLMAQCQGQGQGVGLGQGQGQASIQQSLLQQSGRGGAFGGPGIGQGGVAPEDPTVKNQFKTERSRSALTAGKILLQWKTKEVSDPGEARKNYLDAVTKVKQSYSEAVLQEQVPPGYLDVIQTYFDNIEKTVPAPDAGK